MYFYFMYIRVMLPACMYHMCVVTAEARTGLLGTPKLELQVTVSYFVGAGNRTWVLQRQQVLPTDESSLQTATKLSKVETTKTDPYEGAGETAQQLEPCLLFQSS